MDICQQSLFLLSEKAVFSILNLGCLLFSWPIKFLRFHFMSCPISSSLLPNIRFVVLFLFIREKNSTFAAELRLRAKTSGFLRVYHDI